MRSTTELKQDINEFFQRDHNLSDQVDSIGVDAAANQLIDALLACEKNLHDESYKAGCDYYFGYPKLEKARERCTKAAGTAAFVLLKKWAEQP